jgi:prolyl-tRNA synthetase
LHRHAHNLDRTFKAFDIVQARDKTAACVGHFLGRVDRLVGGVIMTHGDDSGLVLPPNVAPSRSIVPIGRDNWRETVLPRAEIQAAGVAPRDARRARGASGLEVRRMELRGVPRARDRPKDIGSPP